MSIRMRAMAYIVAIAVAPSLSLAQTDQFKTAPQFEARLDALNEAILLAVRARGRCVTSATRVAGRFAIRPCFINPRSSLEDADALVDEVLTVGRSLSSI